MTLTIVATTPEGIVLGGDSRRIKGNWPLPASDPSKIKIDDTVTKVFPFTKYGGVVLSGSSAWFCGHSDETNSDEMVDVLSLVSEYAKSTVNNENIPLSLEQFCEYLRSSYGYDKQLEKLVSRLHKVIAETFHAGSDGMPEVVKIEKVKIGENLKMPAGGVFVQVQDTTTREVKDVCLPMPSTTFLIAGYSDPSSGDFKEWNIDVPFNDFKPRECENEEGKYGVSYIGITTVLQYLTKARYGKVQDILTSLERNELGLSGKEDLYKEVKQCVDAIRPKGKNIDWSKLSLETAASLVEKMIKVTALLQDVLYRFTGGTPKFSVGGPVDIATITPELGFQGHTVKGVRQQITV